jgi:hypothetical protein
MNKRYCHRVRAELGLVELCEFVEKPGAVEKPDHVDHLGRDQTWFARSPDLSRDRQG